MEFDGLHGYPKKQGLYDPDYEKDACGVGYVVSIDGKASNKVRMFCAYTLKLLVVC